jgi:cytochrome c-type biogenesis protein CcmH/NrfG
LGGAYELQGELQKAEGHYRSAIRLGPRESKYYRVLGSMLQKQGPEHLDESIQLLRKGLTLDPTDSEIKIVLARCLEKQGELDDAAALLEQAVVSEPASRRAHSALAELYRRQEKMALAEREQLIAASLEDQKITKEWTIWGAQSAGDP